MRGTTTLITLGAIGACACALAIGGALAPGPDTHRRDLKAQEAAAVGDIVTISGLQIICSDERDASKVYVAGEIALRQSMRMNPHSTFKNVGDMNDAKKRAMASAYSCEWSPTGSRKFVVKKKEIIGKEDSLFHVVEYCLQPADRSGTCWWISGTYDWNAPIETTGDSGKL